MVGQIFESFVGSVFKYYNVDIFKIRKPLGNLRLHCVAVYVGVVKEHDRDLQAFGRKFVHEAEDRLYTGEPMLKTRQKPHGRFWTAFYVLFASFNAQLDIAASDVE